MFETRAQQIGLTGGRNPKAMAARTKKSLVSIRTRIEGLAAPYAEIDNGVELELQDLLNRFDDFEQKINETTEWLLDEAAY